MRPKFVLALATLILGSSTFSFAASGGDHWVGSWGAAPVLAPNKAGTYDDSTVRNIVHLSIGGSSVRITVSNEFGVEPLTVDAASVALSSNDGATKTGTAKAALFGGLPGITIPAGALAVSDAVALPVAPLSDLTVSLHLPAQPLTNFTVHNSALATNYTAAGNQVMADTLTDAKPVNHWFFLKDVDVLAGPDSAAIVAFGDSITDGATSTPDKNLRWPDELSRRLQGDRKFAHLGVINEGIGGNRILRDVTGPSALARLDRDVFAQAGVKYMVLLESINDIGHSFDLKKPYDPVTAESLIQGMNQIIERAHLHGIKIYGATLTPYVGAGYASPDGEAARQKVNAFIRTGGKFDGVIDFDKATQDPQHPDQILPAYNLKDHLHPNDAGYKAMGDSIDLKLFAK